MRQLLATVIAFSSVCCAVGPSAEPRAGQSPEALEARLKDFVNRRNSVTISAEEYVSLMRDLPEGVYEDRAQIFVQPCVERLGKDLVGPLQAWLAAKEKPNCHRAFEILGFFVVVKVPFDPQLFEKLALDGMKSPEHPTHYRAGCYFALFLTHSGKDGLKRLEELLSNGSLRENPGYPAFALTAGVEGCHSLSGASLKHVADALILEPWHDYRNERSRSRMVFENLVADIRKRLDLEDLGTYEEMKKLWVKYRDYLHLRRGGAPLVSILRLDLSAFDAHTPLDPDTGLPK